MSLPTVKVTATPGEPPTVTVNGAAIDGVRTAQIGVGADQMPQVLVSIAAWAVECELPAQVGVLRRGPGAGTFADGVSPARLEGLALEHLELHDGTQGEAFAAAVAQMAAEFDRAHGD
jgi:hypothetical protein